MLIVNSLIGVLRVPTAAPPPPSGWAAEPDSNHLLSCCCRDSQQLFLCFLCVMRAVARRRSLARLTAHRLPGAECHSTGPQPASQVGPFLHTPPPPNPPKPPQPTPLLTLCHFPRAGKYGTVAREVVFFCFFALNVPHGSTQSTRSQTLTCVIGRHVTDGQVMTDRLHFSGSARVQIRAFQRA